MVGNWDEAKAAHWDTAVRGSSALRAAMRRAFKMEVAQLLGEDGVVVAWDMEAFYDGVRWDELYECATEKAYDPILLLLALTVHTARRMIKAGMHCSRWLRRIYSKSCYLFAAYVRHLMLGVVEA